MRFASICSGIEAASVAWGPLGWEPAWFSEIDPFACSVLAQRHPGVPNLGDMTRYGAWPDDAAIDLVCGGTPCQSFSVAGDRGGLDDPRGQLMLAFGGVVARYRPRWLVWENVPGVLSSGGGRDFGAFLGLLGQHGYGFAYRVLDAQYFGLAQRRARVFVVGCLGDWRAAAAVLLERQSLRGDPAPRRQAREGAAAGTLRSTDGGSDVDHVRAGHVVGALTASSGPNGHGASGLATNGGAEAGHLVAFGGNNTSGPIDVTPALLAQGGSGWKGDFESETFIAQAFKPSAYTRDKDGALGPICPPLSREADRGDQEAVLLVPALADPISANEARTYTHEGNTFRLHNVMPGVRRLTPRECERLQGFPDDYTLVRHRGKPALDGPRYKALGNSWAVPVVRWIGRRIQQVDAL